MRVSDVASESRREPQFAAMDFSTPRAVSGARLAFAPLRLPRRSSAQVRAANRIVQRAHALPLELEGQPWWLSLRPEMDGLPLVTAWCIDTLWGDIPFRLWLPVQAVQAWVAHSFSDLDLPDLPQPFLAAILETTGRALLEPLTELGRGQLRVLRIESTHPDTQGQEETWRLQLKSEDTQLDGWLTTTPKGLMHLATSLRDWEPAPGPLAGGNTLSPLPLTLRAEVGYTSMTLSEWAALRPGDAIVVERPLLAPDGELWLACGDGGLRARPSGAQLIVTTPWKLGAWAMDRFEDDDLGLKPLDALRHVPMRVAFDVGELRLTVADLENLQEGQALDLGRPLSEAVQIRVNGARVGLGELVDIDGRLGVVLRSLSARDLTELALGEEDAGLHAGVSDFEAPHDPSYDGPHDAPMPLGSSLDFSADPLPDLPPEEA